MATILEEYIGRHPGSARKYAEATRLFPAGVTHDIRYALPFPLYMTHGSGPRKWDVDGNEYIDYVCGHGALLLGHSHPAITDAVAAQLARGTHLGASTGEEMRWAGAIKALVPSVEKVRFHSSGTEATLMALRLARAYTGKNKIIQMQDHFHGWHDYAMAGSDRSSPGIPVSTWASMVVAPSGDLGALESILKRDSDIAGLILEPTGAHFGQLPLDVPRVLQGLCELTWRYGVALIFDEVVTGFRASPGGAQMRYGVKPDMTTMAKIVAGGLPGGAVGGKAEIMDMMAHREDPDWDGRSRVSHPGTFNANPLSAVAGATCLEMLASQPINRKADAMAERLKRGINDMFARMEIAGHAYGIASMIHVVMADCPCDRETCTMPHEQIKALAGLPAMTALKRGLQNSGVDFMGQESFFVSAVHTEREVDETLGALERTLFLIGDEGLV